MKKLLFMVIGLMFAAQAAFASPMGDRMNLETLNKSDAQVLFQDNTMSQDVVLLGESQMNKLKGKGFWGSFVRSIQRGLGQINRHLSHYFGIKTRSANAGERAHNMSSINSSSSHRGFSIYRY